ncbi:MAG: rhodanese-like domain-containing protein [Bacteroidales bacterium]|nr:rhodanese-like domain-containing protein [Bacteroidales bacterium]
MCSIFKSYIGFKAQGFLNLTPKEAYIELTENNAILLDVRIFAYTAFKKFDVPHTIFSPLPDLENQYLKLPTDKALIVADSAGLFSREAMQLLLKKGFKNIANLAGGIVEWERDNLPVIEDINERLSGSCTCQLRPRHKTINKRKK